MTKTSMLSIGNFSRSVGARTGKVELVPAKAYSQAELIGRFAGGLGPEEKPEVALGRKVSIDYMYQKLLEHKLIDEKESEELKKTVHSKQELADAIFKKYDPGDASASVSNMANGILLGNGIIVPENDKETAQRLSRLSRNDVATFEKVLGCDYSAGTGIFHLKQLARCRENGLIQGELELSHFSTLKFILDLNPAEGETMSTLMKERIKDLYNVLESNDAKGGFSAWRQDEGEINKGLASIKF